MTLAEALEGRYRIDRQLGEGGMATVYLADDLKHQRQVAIKVLKPELAAVVGSERFLTEIRTTANLQHPHILPLFDSGEAETFLFYVMPYVEGESLRERLDREGQLPVDEAVRIATSVAEALDYAHRQGVVHRDIKPANILLHESQPLVADFGIAIALSAAGGGRMTETGLSLGTPHYMSPEQATAERELTGKSDQYALGCVLYEMLVGTPPHTGSSAHQVIMKIVADEARPVRELRRSVPENVADAVGRSLEKLPADRFGSAGELAAALRDPGFRRAASADGAVGIAVQEGRGRSLLPWAVAAAAVVVALFGWMRGSSPPATARAPAEFVVTTIEAAQIDLTTLVERFAVSPDGENIVTRSEDPESGVQRLMLRRLRSLEASAFANAWAPTFSPDGKDVAFVTGRLFTAPVDGSSPPTDVAPAPVGAGLSWKEPGTILFRRADHFQHYYSVSPVPGSPVDTIAVRGDTVLWSAESLDEERILVSLSTGGRDVLAVREADGSFRDVLSGRNGTVTPTDHVVFARRTASRWSLVAAPFDRSAAEVVDEEIVLSSDVPLKYSLPAAVTEAGDLYLLEGVPRADRRITVIDRTGREVDTGFQPGPWVGVAASPSGLRLAGTRWDGRDRSIWVGDLSTDLVDRLTFDGDHFLPVWSPEGDRIAYTYFPEGPLDDRARTSMWWTRADGSGDAQPIGEMVSAYPYSFAPDGGSLFYHAQQGSNDLWTVSVEGAEAERVLETRASELWPLVSPDGVWMAYQSDASGRLQLRVAPLSDLSSPEPVTAEGGEPLGWSADSQRLFYYVEGGDVWEVDVGSDGPDVSRRRVAFELPDDVVGWSVMPDGDRLVVVRGGPIQADLIVRQGALPVRR